MDSFGEMQKQVDDFCRAVSKATKTFIKVMRQLIDWAQKLDIQLFSERVVKACISLIFGVALLSEQSAAL